MIGMRENRPPDRFVHAALRQDRLALLGVPLERRMNLPIEIVQQGGDGPHVFVLSQLLRIRRHARLHRQRVLAESVGLGELTKDVPGLFSIEHEHYDTVPQWSPQLTFRAPRKASRSRLVTRTVLKPPGVQVSRTMSPGLCWG